MTFGTVVATFAILVVVAGAIRMMKKRDPKPAAAAYSTDYRPSPSFGPDTTIKPGDPGYDSIVDTAKGAAGNNQPQ